MSKAPFGFPAITLSRRALIIQRVLVDGWTSAKVAATFDVSERQVDAWVADYRRHGMMSLRQAAGRPLTAKIIRLTVSRPVRAVALRMANGLRRLLAGEPPPQPLLLRRSKDDRIGGK
jgi:transposase-like protein